MYNISDLWITALFYTDDSSAIFFLYILRSRVRIQWKIINERKISLIILTKNKDVFLKAECSTQVWKENVYPTDKMKPMKK